MKNMEPMCVMANRPGGGVTIVAEKPEQITKFINELFVDEKFGDRDSWTAVIITPHGTPCEALHGALALLRRI